uniref:Succinate:cytochrome c oxidoreductase subunit 3 n=1 Tax=Wildemania schizophylla TaxID=1134705 RepID=A0A068F010_WILSC|nr:succinate:cytochrome c oxidoreductase subunit 3 [Wildemania schizophylla]AID57267.1 succinate:cytochrome c oxidoreductase subunit 3 [Wildemania schizophylla]
MYNINRPISPHLTIYNSQISSIFSIWHRISGFTMFILITIPFFTLNNVLFTFINISLSSLTINFVLVNFVLPGFLIVISAIFLYHILNGLRHLLWDSVMHVTTKKINKDSHILLFLIATFVLTKLFIEI